MNLSKISLLSTFCIFHAYHTAVLKGKGDHLQESARFARLLVIYFCLDPLFSSLFFQSNMFVTKHIITTTLVNEAF